MAVHRTLQEVTLRDVALCGGKAARLGEAVRLGLPVPPAVVLPTDLYRRFMGQGGLQGEIASILSTLQPNAWTHFQATEWAIQSAFRMRRAPSQIADAILEASRALTAPRIVIRSSATNEDSPQQSFVGQYYFCLLDRADEAGVVAAVYKCWMSLFSAKALAYAHHFDVDLLNSSMAVLMQEAILPELRGALFTADPIGGNPDEFLLEVRASDDRDANSLAGVHSLDPYAPQADEPFPWGQLRKVGLMLDEHLRQYQTVEWATAGGQLHLLRVRPMTAVPDYLPPPSPPPGPGTFELVKPPQQTPRETWPHSWYHISRSEAMRRAYFGQASRLFLSHTGREDHYFCGYCYSRWHGASAQDVPSHHPALRLSSALQRVYAATKLDQDLRIVWGTMRPRLDELGTRDVSALSKRELCAHLREVTTLGEMFWEQSGRLGESGALLAELVSELGRRWVSEPVEARSLLDSARDSISRRDAALCRLARASYASEAEREAAWETFFRQYRHLYLADHPLQVGGDTSRIVEDREAVQHELERWAAPENPPAWQEQTERSQHRQELERRVLGQLRGPQRLVFRHVLRLALRYAPWRVDRDEPVLLCLVLERDVVREVGRRLQAEGVLAQPDDAFNLTHAEIVSWLQDNAATEQLAQTIRDRQEQWRRWVRYSPPPVYPDTQAQVSRLASPAVFAIMALSGRPICRGVVEGRVRVIHSLAEAASVLAGEGLVCREPIFELSPLFSVVAAVVAETGGLLDHAAVLAREFGVPAVFGVTGATDKLRTGDEVRVDADRGLISRRQSPADWGTPGPNT